jgi:hypothetical protein
MHGAAPRRTAGSVTVAATTGPQLARVRTGACARGARAGVTAGRGAADGADTAPVIVEPPDGAAGTWIRRMTTTGGGGGTAAAAAAGAAAATSWVGAAAVVPVPVPVAPLPAPRTATRPKVAAVEAPATAMRVVAAA